MTFMWISLPYSQHVFQTYCNFMLIDVLTGCSLVIGYSPYIVPFCNFVVSQFSVNRESLKNIIQFFA